MHKSYLISVSAGAGCYRHIKISANATLFDLHAAILSAFEFEDDHAHAFFMNNRAWSEDGFFSAEIEDEPLHTSATKLRDLELDVSKQFKYMFDFGDEWQFQCKVLRVLDEKTPNTEIVKSVGDPPAQYDDGPIDLPEEYDKVMLKRMYGSLALPDKTVELLHEYFDAFANMYHIIPLRKALEIYNRQNPPITEANFVAFVEIVRHERHFYAILGQDELYVDGDVPKDVLDRELVQKGILDDLDEYESLKAGQANKPYYIPGKAALLKYADDLYFERTPEFDEMQRYLHSIMACSKDRAEELAEELQMHAAFDERNIQWIIDDMARMGLELKGLKQVQDFVDRYSALANHTRIAYNRGYTPMEMSAMSGPPKEIKFGPGLTGALERGELDIKEMRRGAMGMYFPSPEMKASFMGELNKVKVKIGRNDPCPCDSGKKYKQCCGKNA